MMERVKWWWYEAKRLKRLWLKPEKSVEDLVRIVGFFWLWRRGAKREFRVKLWQNSPGWYALDLALPHVKLGVEADGSVHQQTYKQDIVRDQRLHEKGWRIMRVDYRDMRDHPRRVRRQVRRFLSGR